MKVSIRKKMTCLIVILSGIINHTISAEQPNTIKKGPIFGATAITLHENKPNQARRPKEQANATPITILDTLINETKKQTNQIHTLLSGLSAMISDNQVSVTRKKETLNNLKQISNLIQNIQREKFVHANMATVQFLLQFNQELMRHLLQASKRGFTHIASFDPTTLIKRNPQASDNLEPEAIERLLKKNKQQLTQLTTATDRAGLRWYNLMYRKFDRFFIQPSIKYSIPSRTLTIGGASATICYLWWRFGETSFKRICPAPVYNKVFGPHPKVGGPQGNYIENEAELKALGKLEFNLQQLGHGFLPIGAAIAAFTYNSFKSEWGDKDTGFKAWIAKKVSIMHNKLRGGAYLKEAQKSAEKVDEVTFDDIVGLDHIKESFKLLVSYLENPEPFDRLGLTPPKGILLVGETRTGKSYSVKALFGEISKMLKTQSRKDEFKFIELNASEVNQYGIQYLLNLVKKCAPCIVFIDEIDLLDLQRKGKNQMLSELLTCMSGTLDSKDPKNQVILIGATNMPENLDSALRQPGRFGQEHRFEYPSLQDRKALIARKLEKLSLNVEQFNLDKLALDTESKSYEALNVLINNALLKSRINGQILTQEYIEETLDAEIRHVVASDTKVIPDYQTELLSIHFAGHALALMLLNTHTKLSKVTIQQVMTDIKEEFMGMHLYKKKEDEKQKRFEYGNVFTHHTNDVISNMYTHDETLALCKFHLAGIAAEKIIIGSCGYSCHKEDKNRALALAQALAFEGIDVARMPKHIQAQRHDKAMSIVEACEKEVTELLLANKNALTTIAHNLQDKKSLSIDAIAAIIKENK